MLLNKFQRDCERQQRKEEKARCEKDHWRCPFFVYCWEEGLTLPSAYDCPECNGQGSRSYKRSRHVDESYQCERTHAYDRLGKRVSVHDRLGAGPCCVILLEDEYLHTIGWNRWPMTECNMISRCEEIQSMNLIVRVNLNGVQEV